MKNPLPREIVPGVFWLGQCLEQHFQGKVYHAYNAAFLIIGSESSLLVETGHPGDFAEINRQVKDIVLPKKVNKERRKKILSEGIIETWRSEQEERKAKEARKIAKETYKKIRSSKDKGDG